MKQRRKYIYLLADLIRVRIEIAGYREHGQNAHATLIRKSVLGLFTGVGHLHDFGIETGDHIDEAVGMGKGEEW